MRRRLLALVFVVVAAAVAAAVVFWPRGTTEVSEQEALDDYRGRTTTSADGGSDDTTDPTEPTEPADLAGPASRTVPAPGVYTFAASGQEDVKLGPLPAETRPFPESVTAVVVDGGDGCFELTVNLFAEHTEDTRYCTDGGVLTLGAHTKHQQIGPLSPTATVACDPATLLSTESTDHDLACTLELSGGPAAISATLAGTATRGEPEQRTVGTDTVTTTPLTITHRVSGDLSGTWTERLWLTETNLPVRIERTLDLSGPATFTERSVLDLQSLTPTT